MIMVLCNIPLISKNVYFHFLEDCVRFVFQILLHALPPLYQPHRELLSPEQSNSLLQFGIYFAHETVGF